ncbi:MAG: cation-translocating P-type ATPase [Streptococcaceae bacterium]|nr:cation-translocating P-type ATPase [Streptococcaceae bacterium]
MKENYQKTIEQIMSELNTSASGLSANFASEKLKVDGYNQLKNAPKKSTIKLFLETLKDAMVIILLLVVVIQILMGNWIESTVIITVLLLNSFVSVIQEKKAESSLDTLKNLSAPNARVIREGKETTVLAKELVIGDIVLLEAGDCIPADGRLIEASSLKVDEGMLTGESTQADKEVTSIEKNVPIGDRVNMVFSGTIATYGRGIFIVTQTGTQTQIGQVASLLEGAEETTTPLQRNLDKFSKKLSLAILALALGILIFKITQIVIQGSNNPSADIIDAFMLAIAVAVAAIPEALKSIVTIILSIGTKKMARQNAIIRKLTAVETLGSTSIICTDKTGTLTQNKMTVVDNFLINEEKADFTKDNWTKAQEYLIQISSLANDASITQEEVKLGDPTETALIDFVGKVNRSYQKMRENAPRLAELPFDSDRKLMSSVHLLEGQKLLLTKGAPDVLFNRATQVLINNEVTAITPDILEEFKKKNEEFSNRALRVLAFAYKTIETNEITFEDEENLILVGLLAMIDPPREEVYEAIQEAKSAGIKTIMITGDHKTTAKAIAREIGIFEDGDIALTGLELDELTEHQLFEMLEKISVYARVSPENKIRIVKAWQEKGCISAMTGDGVNDAPALKQADIGIAMGTGTDVAKDAASMVLSDDNFTSIVHAIALGRNVFDNIKKVISYLFAGNLGAIIAIVVSMLMGWNAPFTALQLLFINLVNDSVPAIAIGLEKGEPSIMKKAPRDPKKGLFTGQTLISVIYRGILIAASVIAAQWIGMQVSSEIVVAMTFSTLIWSRTLQTFVARSNSQTIFQTGLMSNKAVLVAIAFCGSLYGLTLLPQIRALFSIPQSFGLLEVAISIGLSLAAILMMELTKFAVNKIEMTKTSEIAVAKLKLEK